MKSPSYYGPAPTTAVSADYQTAGSLSCAVQLDSRLVLRSTGPQLEEKYKTNTRACMTTAGRGFSVFGAEFLPDHERPTLNQNFVSRFPAPTLDGDAKWIIIDVSIQQQEPGDHSIFTVRYKASDSTSGATPGGGFASQDNDHWDLEWKPLDMSVLAYCKNENKPPTWVRFLPNVNEDILKPAGQPGIHAQAHYIKECASGSRFNSKWGQLGMYEWVRNQSIYTLNAAEKKIFNYYINGYNPVIHTPVLTHTFTTDYLLSGDAPIWTGSTDPDKMVKHMPYEHSVGKIDEVVIGGDSGVTLSSTTCPYKFDDTWEWLKTGQMIHETHSEGKTTYTCTEELTGAKRWSGDFYKNGTWSINGEVPQNPWEIGQV